MTTWNYRHNLRAKNVASRRERKAIFFQLLES